MPPSALFTRTLFAFGALLALPLGGCHDPRVADILALDGDPDAGAVVYHRVCDGCHSTTDGGPFGPVGPFVRERSDEAVLHRVLRGKAPDMPPFDDELEDQELADLLAHLRAEFDAP